VSVGHHDDRVQTAIGGERLIGTPAIADEISTVVPVLDVEHPNRQRHRLIGDEAAVLEPHLLQFGKVRPRRGNASPQTEDRRLRRRRRGQATAEVDEARAECRRVADAGDMRHGADIRIAVLGRLAQMEMHTLHVGAGFQQLPKGIDGFARGHAERATEAPIASITLVRRMDAHADPPPTVEGHREQRLELARRVEMDTQARERIATEPGMLGGPVDEKLIGTTTKAPRGRELTLADHLDAASTGQPPLEQPRQGVGLVGEPRSHAAVTQLEATHRRLDGADAIHIAGSAEPLGGPAGHIRPVSPIRHVDADVGWHVTRVGRRHACCGQNGVPLTYILPFKARAPVSDELLDYLRGLAALDVASQILVVDGSEPAIYANFAARCPDAVEHVGVDPDLSALANGKVRGVLTGVRHARHPLLVIADDDVRYDEASLAAVVTTLEQAEIVRPQNFFAPLPWHACLDTARMLINRVTGGDWPGTLGVRRSALQATAGYDGDVLFENLELVRTVTAAGGRELRPLDLFVRRLPPRTAHFWSQRVRQAYDEFARPARLMVSLALVPGVLLAIVALGWPAIGVAVTVPIVMAEAGRRLGDGTKVFPAVASLAAPLWVLERGLCAWAAVLMRLGLGGVPYAGRIVRRAATPVRILARRHAGAIHVARP